MESVAGCTFRPDTSKSRQSGRRIGIAGAGAGGGSGNLSARSAGSAGHDDAGEPTGPGGAGSGGGSGSGGGGGASARSGGIDGKEAHDRLYEAALAKAARARAAAAEAAAAASPECTFRPSISAGSRRLLAAHGRDGDGLASAAGAAHVPRHLLLYEDGLHRQQQRLAAEANRGPEGLKPDDLINCSFQPTVHTLPSRLVAPAAVPVHDRLYENARAKQAALAAAVAALRSPPTQFGPGAPTASQAAAAAAQAHSYAYAASAGVAGRIPSLNTSPVPPHSRSASRSPTRMNGASSSLSLSMGQGAGEGGSEAQAPIFPSVRLGFTPPPVLARDVVSTNAVQAAGVRARSLSRDHGELASARSNGSVGSAHANAGNSSGAHGSGSSSGNPNSKQAEGAAATAAPAPAPAPAAAPAPAVSASADGSLFPPLPAGLLFSVSPPTVEGSAAAAAPEKVSAPAAAASAAAPAPESASAPEPAPAPGPSAAAASAGPAQGLAGRVTFPISPPPMSPFSVGSEAGGSAAASPPQGAAGDAGASSAAQA